MGDGGLMSATKEGMMVMMMTKMFMFMLHKESRLFGRPLLAPDLMRLSPALDRPSSNAKANHPAS